MSKKKKSSRPQLLRGAKKIFQSLKAKARAEFPRSGPIQAKGILLLPSSGTPLEIGRNFSMTQVAGANRAGIWIIGGSDGEDKKLTPGIYHVTCTFAPGLLKLGIEELREFPDFLLKFWVEAGIKLLKSKWR